MVEMPVENMEFIRISNGNKHYYLTPLQVKILAPQLAQIRQMEQQKNNYIKELKNLYLFPKFSKNKKKVINRIIEIYSDPTKWDQKNSKTKELIRSKIKTLLKKTFNTEFQFFKRYDSNINQTETINFKALSTPNIIPESYLYTDIENLPDDSSFEIKKIDSELLKAAKIGYDEFIETILFKAEDILNCLIVIRNIEIKFISNQNQKI